MNDQVQRTDTNTCHPTRVPGCNYSNHELGHRIGEMRYDAILEVLEGLENEMQRQQKSDYKRGRKQLARFLSEAVGNTKRLRNSFDKIFRLSRPYMQHEFDRKKE